MTESKLMYQTTAINTGGRNGESHLPDGSFSVKVSTPKQMGGPGQGTNPEQLFAAGWSACSPGNRAGGSAEDAGSESPVRDLMLYRLPSCPRLRRRGGV